MWILSQKQGLITAFVTEEVQAPKAQQKERSNKLFSYQYVAKRDNT